MISSPAITLARSTTLTRVVYRYFEISLFSAVSNRQLPKIAPIICRALRQLNFHYPPCRRRARILPATVVSLWLSVSKSPVALADALLQNHSVLARRFAIVRFGKTLRSPQWWSIWNHLGGTEGLLSVFAELYVEDVKLLAKVIGRCNKGQKDQEKQEQVTKLLCGLPSLTLVLHTGATTSAHSIVTMQKWFLLVAQTSFVHYFPNSHTLCLGASLSTAFSRPNMMSSADFCSTRSSMGAMTPRTFQNTCSLSCSVCRRVQV